MTRKDYVLAAAFTLLDLLLCGAWYWFPPERYFDEIYYPRSAAEYLQWQPQFEWTHPPLTKLIIALSMLMWGGVHSPLGDTGFGWRFLNVVIGAATVFLLYVFAKRLTNSTLFASVAAALLVLDGFHFTQSRIATPEITVAFFSLLILYAFYRYWTAQDGAPDMPPAKQLAALGGISIVLGVACGVGLVGALARQSGAAVDLMTVFFIFAFYAAGRLALRPKPRALGWLVLLGLACGLGAASKWNALFDLVLVVGFAAGIVLLPRPKWRLPLDAFVAVVMSLTIGLYLASYIPFFLTPQPATYESRHDLSGLMDLQNQMYTYHDVTVTHNAPHPYSSKWWEWPLLYQPVVYWDKDSRSGANVDNPRACCFAEIISLPNPLTWWLGLLSVPFLGYLAWRERNKGYLLLFAAYFIQWLPWIASPRMLFEYHFFPNDAIILLADTIAVKWVWDRAQGTFEHEQFARYGLGLFLAGTLVMFAYFYPVLAGSPLTWDDWYARMWFVHWIRGPG